jgi:excisionase family DNA binding protein
METLLKVEEVAALIQISAKTIYRYVENGKIPFCKIGGFVRFKPSEIEKWLDNREAVSKEQRQEDLDYGE